MASSGSILVEHFPHHPKVEGSSLAEMGERNMAKRI
jgi:hypothetical protein